jgi:hypothetical protein
MCSLESWPIELLLLTVLLGYPFVLNRSKQEKITWTNVILAPFLSLGFMWIYETGLHSPVFPRALLNKSVIEEQERIQQRREKLNLEPNQPEIPASNLKQ